MKIIFGILSSVLFFVILVILIGLSGFAIHGCNRASGLAHNVIDVVADQLEPKELLRKYEWFKDASAQLDKKMADIQVYENRFNQLRADYPNKTRTEWAKDDREQYNIWVSEASGIKASYNSLAAEYNSEMAKINWRFCNVGDLPKGATTVLPRDYKPYMDK